MKQVVLGLAAALMGLALLGGCGWASFTRRAVNPYPGNPASAARGLVLYTELCTACHGLAGRGDGPAAGELRRPPPDFTDRGRMVARGDPDLFWMIERGSRFEGVMPPFKDRLSEAERWDLVNYVRTLYLASP